MIVLLFNVHSRRSCLFLSFRSVRPLELLLVELETPQLVISCSLFPLVAFLGNVSSVKHTYSIKKITILWHVIF